MYPDTDQEMVFGPFQVGALRVLIAGLVLLPLAIYYRKLLSRSNWYLLLIVGLFGSLMPAMLFTLAETKIDSSLAGLLNMMTTFFVVIIGITFYKAKPTWKQLIGLALGSTGLYLVLSGEVNVEANKDMRYAFFLFPATLGYAVSLTTIKFRLQELPSNAITALSFSLVLIPALIICLFTDAFQPIYLNSDGTEGLGYISILAVFGTAIAVLLFTRLISISSHIFASAVSYVIPVVAIIIGVLFGETFPLINILWVVLILAGVYLMNRSKKMK